MTTTNPIIVGAGLAGLIAAHAWPHLAVFEAAPEPVALHKAVLRFRSTAVSDLTGVPFRKVRVHKAIWSAGKLHTEANILLANRYATKVLGRLAGDRSIWSLDAVDRYVAPDTLYEQLVECAKPRIIWNSSVGVTATRRSAVISTAPLPVTLMTSGIEHNVKFERAPITVVRARIPGADVFQTVYFPDADCPMYRASITGDMLIVEAVVDGVDFKHWWARAQVLIGRAMGVEQFDLLESREQRYGKISPIADAERKRLLFELTSRNRVYSLGRFATWRNILLDDVVHDISVIKRLLLVSDYDLRHHAS